MPCAYRKLLRFARNDNFSSSLLRVFCNLAVNHHDFSVQPH